MVSNNDLLAAPAKPAARSRNIALDNFFYDVDSLSENEKATVLKFFDHEGAIVVVSPLNADKPVRYYENTTEMLTAEKSNIGGVAVAGVGSSILGTAALARNVADTYGRDIAGIVSGYGATDLLMEALGGWFFYGYTDKYRHVLEIMVEQAANGVSAPLRDATNASIDVARDSRESWIPRQLDSGTLLDILLAVPDNMDILVGHSKGAMLIDFVLEEFVRRMQGQAHRYYDELHVVTVGAVVGVPRNFKRTSQIIGALDWFGGMNSLPDLSVGWPAAPAFWANAWRRIATTALIKSSMLGAWMD